MFELQVRDFNIAKSDKDIGYYAGYIGEPTSNFKEGCSRLGSCAWIQVGMFSLLG